MTEKCVFTSDLHFSHKKFVTLKFRPHFNTVDEMNETIVGNWNEVVNKRDRVYLLGDVALGRPEAAAKLLKRLNGRIYLIRGNHDDVAEHKLVAPRFEWIKDLHYFQVEKQKIMLCHYAMRSWRAMHHGSWMLFGHSHGHLDDVPTLRTMDVGVDCNAFFPLTFEMIKKKIGNRPLGRHHKTVVEDD